MGESNKFRVSNAQLLDVIEAVLEEADSDLAKQFNRETAEDPDQVEDFRERLLAAAKAAMW